jgi:DNA-binding NarL/FixJ family response regulator
MTGAALSLRRASDIWRDLDMPYEEARTRLLMAAVCERRGDEDSRRLELECARTLLTRLGGEQGVAGITMPAHPAPRPAPEVLSARETQVLRQVAAGKTNRAIADDLCISEKTVARHISNIFNKLDVSTRTEAAAWAYRRGLT